MDAVIVCDLDGVLWRGDDPIVGAADTVTRWQLDGRRVGFLTNNASHRVVDVVDKLARMGVAAAPEDVVTSAQAGAEVLRAWLEPGARVLVAGGPGLVEAVAAAGLSVVDNDREPGEAVAAVVCGFHRDFDFGRLDRAAAAIRAGARFVATNTDPTYPASGRVLPGAGALVAAIATASGVAPVVAGKPEAPIAELVRRRFGPVGVMVGDRPSTDGRFAERLGWPFAMVLSGIGGHDPAEPVPDPAPRFLGTDLAALADPLAAHRGP